MPTPPPAASTSVTDLGWEPAGPMIQGSGQFDRIPAFDPRSGEHLWTVNGCWRVNPGSDAPTLLDLENMLLLGGPICWYCEQVYEPRLKHRRCPGEPVD